jgi:hypothetical protein
MMEKQIVDAEILKEQALAYERLYFEDFTFQEGSIAGDIYLRKKNKFPIQHFAPPIPLPNAPNIYHIKFKVEKPTNDKAEGVYNAKTKTIIVHPDFNDELTLLHEMIHAYEDQFTYAQGEILTVMLYSKLKNKIKNLDLVLMKWAHYDNQGGGDHAILFLLKSLDLELRLDLRIGAISGFYSNYRNTLETYAGKIKIERFPDNP